MKRERALEILGLVKKNYQEIAADFSVTRQKELWPEIQKLANQVFDGARVLDAGCGNGRLLKAFQGRSLEYWGLDNSQALLNFAKKDYPNSRFIQGDVLELNKWSELNFDYIFCLAVLQHIPSQELRGEAYRQLADKLAPGGRLIISVWNLWSRPLYRHLLFKARWLKILGRSNVDSRDLIFPWKNSQGQIISQRYYHAFTRCELKRLAKISGLEVEKLYKDNYNYWLILKKN